MYTEIGVGTVGGLMFKIMIVILISGFNSFASDSIYTLEKETFKVESLFKGDDVIWGFDFLSPSEIIFSEKKGKLRIINLANLKISEVEGAPAVFAEGQGGLLDVLYDKKSTKIFLTFSKPIKKGAATALFKGQLNKEKNKIEGSEIFEAKNFEEDIDKAPYHFGSRVVISGKYLFISLGEKNNRKRAQELNSHHGKILRLYLDGSTPKDNPFAQQKRALPEIWTLGHRNPQGLTSFKGELYSAEFGPQGGDEVNLIKKGKNYGWPVITYGREYSGPKIGTTKKKGMEQPLLHWEPSISPSGFIFYDGNIFKSFKDNIFLACLGSTHLHRVVMKNKKKIKEDIMLADLNERFRQVKVGPDGLIYLSTDSGKLLRLIPATNK